MQNDLATPEDSLEIYHKTTHILTIRYSSCTPCYLTKGVANLCPHTKASTQMFMAALFFIAKTWKQPRCPSVGEWISKLWYIQTMEYYPALK